MKKRAPQTGKNAKRQHRTRPLVVERLEMVSKALFKQYYPLITQLIGSSHGIYALYDTTDLYYVGKSTDLRNRVRAHLRDRHLASWTHFSLFLVRNAEHLSDIESLLVRIANPNGNRVHPRGTGNSALRHKLQALIRERQRDELSELFGQSVSRGSRMVSAGRKAAHRRDSIAGLVDRRTELFRTYKGKEFRAYLLPNGAISLGGKRYDSPSAAGKAATGRSTCNGWMFWYIRNSDGDWTLLSDYSK